MTPDQDKLPGVTSEELLAMVRAETERLHATHGDPFRRHHVQLSAVQRQFIDQLKDEAISAYSVIAALPPSKERSMALTRFEEAIMLAVKAATAKDAFGEGS